MATASNSKGAFLGRQDFNDAGYISGALWLNQTIWMKIIAPRVVSCGTVLICRCAWEMKFGTQAHLSERIAL